jgi:serine/threonine protein kinase/tetratricopeptide (TPR) repeat protein
MSAEEHSEYGLPDSAAASTAADSQPTMGDSSPAEGPALERGTTIGRYVVIEKIGAGAMGVVYAAYDPELDRKLALKVLRLRGTSPKRRAIAHTRMVREAQALAKLSHPNVIAIHDVGTFHAGVFVVMDFVDGCTLDEWVEQTVKGTNEARDASWHTIVGAFAQAAHGLAAAHEAGLVHRDFKPSNVIVDKQDRVRVLDFGLARAVDPNNVPTTGEFQLTATSGDEFSGGWPAVSSHVLDLDSFSDGEHDEHDEHDELVSELAEANGECREAVDATDKEIGESRASGSHSTRRLALEQQVTRIGATLGTPAYMSPEQHLGEVAGPQSDQFSFCVALYEALYGEVPFPGESPATKALAVTEGNLKAPPRSRVPNRIRDALLRGLSTRPEDRFPDMPGILKELERAPKRRSAGWVILGVAGILGFGGWAVAAQVTAPQLCGGADQKIAQVWDGEDAAAVEQAFVATDKPYASHSLAAVREKLDLYADEWRTRYRDTCEATHRHGVQSAELMDLRMGCLERRRREFGALVDVFTEADDQVIENAIPAAADLAPLEACSQLMPSEGDLTDPDDSELLAIERDLARVKALRRSGKYAEASKLGFELVDRVSAKGDRRLQAEITATLGSVLADESRYVEARDMLTDAARHAEFVGDDRLLAGLRNQLAMISGERLGETQAGHVWIALSRSTIDRLGGDLELEANRHSSLALIYDREGRHKEELAEKRKALELYKQTENPDAYHLAGFRGSLASVLAQLGEHKEALTHAQASLEGFKALLGPDHPRTAIGHATLGLVYDYHGDYKAALQEYERSAAVLEAATGPEHGRMAEVLNNLAITQISLGHVDDGVKLFERVVRIKEKNLPAGHLEIASALGNLGGALRMQGRAEEALAYQERALEIRRAALPDDHPDLASSLAAMANNLESLGRNSESLPMRQQAVSIYEESYGRTSPSIVVDLSNLVFTYVWNDKPKPALEAARRAVAIVESNDVRPDTSAFARVALAEAILANRGDEKEARRQAELALEELGDLPASTERDLLEKMSKRKRWKLDTAPAGSDDTQGSDEK